MSSKNGGRLRDPDKLVTRGQLDRVLRQVVKNHLDRHHAPPEPWAARLEIWFYTTWLGRRVHAVLLARMVRKAHAARVAAIARED